MHYRAGKDWFKQTLLPSGVGRYTVGNSGKIVKTRKGMSKMKKELFKLALHGLKGKKRSSLLTVIILTISFAAVLVTLCYALHNGQHYKNECGIQAEHLRRMVRRNTVRN